MKIIKQILYRVFGLNTYLLLLQKGFKIGYQTGFLKRNPEYKWHYFIKNLVKKEDTIIDIGANLGYFSFIFGNIIDNTGALYCVEPVEPFRNILKKILPAQKNIYILPFALGDKDEANITMGMPAWLEGLGYLRHGTVSVLNENDISQNKFVFTATIRKADDVFKDFKKIDYIKCDIEGYERIVIPCLKKILVKHQPLVQLETWGEQLPQMLSFFDEIGFSPYHLNNNRLVACQQMNFDEIADSDILFVHKNKTERIAKFMK